MTTKNQPAPGDVLITIEDGNYLLSIVPNSARLRFGTLERAVAIALKWTETNHNSSVWQEQDGRTTQLPIPPADLRAKSTGS